MFLLVCLRLGGVVTIVKRNVIICLWDQNLGCWWNTDTIPTGTQLNLFFSIVTLVVGNTAHVERYT